MYSRFGRWVEMAHAAIEPSGERVRWYVYPDMTLYSSIYSNSSQHQASGLKAWKAVAGVVNERATALVPKAIGEKYKAKSMRDTSPAWAVIKCQYMFQFLVLACGGGQDGWAKATHCESEYAKLLAATLVPSGSQVAVGFPQPCHCIPHVWKSRPIAHHTPNPLASNKNLIGICTKK